MDVRADGDDLSYTYDPQLLTAGASLGTPAAFAYLDPNTDVRGIWNAGDNRFSLGSWEVSLLFRGVPLNPLSTVFTAASQQTDFGVGRLHASKLFFLPFLEEAAVAADPEEMQAALMLLEFRNDESAEGELVLSHHLTFPAVPCPLFTKQPPESETRERFTVEEQGGVLVARPQTRPGELRALAGDLVPEQRTSDERSAGLLYRFTVRPGERRHFRFVFAWSSDREGKAIGRCRRCLEDETLLDRTRATVGDLASRSTVATPDPLVNRGVEWAKVNTLRVQHRYRTGAGFTNDPPQDIVVIRDLAWYILGADHLTPLFSRALLENAICFGRHEGGKLTEFYHADEVKPELHDYRLNINDDTPLFVIAAWHHVQQHGDDALLERFYPAMRAAADWILEQREEGLVRCHAGGTNVWGICGWRNIIDGYTLSGAVTEINAECSRALAIAGAAARRLNRREEALRFERAAADLRDALNTRLISEKTALYVLNIDEHGERHDDVTGDQIIPVMFDVAGAEPRRRILERLTCPDFWTESGVRTVPPDEPHFDPESSYQLLGGVWPNLTAWVGWSLREERPELLVEAMRCIYRISEAERPADLGFVVPGEFPERLHGTRFTSRGMAMSPWMPPTYLWLAVEGLMGFNATPEGVTLNPHLPQSWSWSAVFRLPVRGQLLDAFCHQGTLYATMPVITRHTLVVGEPLTVGEKPPGLHVLALQTDGHVIVCAGTDRPASGSITVASSRGTLHLTIRLDRGEAMVITDPE